LAISPCNKFLASGSADNSIVLYDLINHSVINNFRIFKGNVTSVKFSPDGKWLGAVGGDGQVLLVNMVTKSVSDIKQVNTFLRDLDFNKTNNELVTTGNNGRISYWSITEKGLIAQKLETRVGFSWLMSVQLTLDGKSFMVADSRGRVRVQTPFGKIDKNLKVPVFKAILRPGPNPHIFVVAATRGKGVEVFTGLEMNHRL
jgi:WD40 repeat protein